MYCKKCGKKLKEGAVFCKECGTKVKSNKKKIIIISSIVIILIAILSIGGYFVYKNYTKQQEKKETEIKEDWGKKYYNYLVKVEKIRKENLKKEKNISTEEKDIKINFYEVEGNKYPVLVESYKWDGVNKVDISYIDEQGRVQNPNTGDRYDKVIKLLYNKKEGKYKYYICYNEEDETGVTYYYDPLSKIIDDYKSEDALSTTEYRLSKNTKGWSTKYDYILDFPFEEYDNLFYEPEYEDDAMEFKWGLSKKELKKRISKLVDNYKKKEDTVSKESKKEVESFNSNVENTENENNENENTSDALNVGGSEIKYGTHNVYDSANNLVGSMIIRKDGTYQVSGEYFSRVAIKSGKYYIGKRDISQDIAPMYVDAVCLEDAGDGSPCYAPYTNGTFLAEVYHFEYVG